MRESVFFYQKVAEPNFPFSNPPTVDIDQWFIQEIYQKPTLKARADLYPFEGKESRILDILSPLQSLTFNFDPELGKTLGLHGKSLPLTTISNAPMGAPPGNNGVVIQRFDHNVRIFVWDVMSGTWIGLQIPDVAIVNQILNTGTDGQILVKNSLVPFGLNWADTGSFIHHEEVNFGATGVRSKTFTLSDPDVLVGQHHVMAFQSANAATGRSQDENEMDAIMYRAVPGPSNGQITVYADSLFGPVAGLYVLHFIVTPMHIM